MTDMPDRESLAAKALAHAQNPDGAWMMGKWVGRHLSTEDLYDLVEYIDEYVHELEQIRAERNVLLDQAEKLIGHKLTDSDQNP